MKRWSTISFGGFSEIEISHITGIRANRTTRTMAIVQAPYSRVPCFISTPRSTFIDAHAEAFDEDERNNQHNQEDHKRDRRADSEVETVDQLFEAEDRDRFGVFGATGHDEDRVEDPERLEGP